MDPKNFKIPFHIFSSHAVSAARRYVALFEAQLGQAYTDEKAVALEEFRTLIRADDGDYAELVGSVEKDFEEFFWPLHRYSIVVYLFMIFERYARMHAAEIQRIRKCDENRLHLIEKKKKCGLVDAVMELFEGEAGLDLLDELRWNDLRCLGHLRNCIVHNAGIAKNAKCPKSIYALEKCEVGGKRIGIEIPCYKDQDLGEPLIIHHQFLNWILNLLEFFFCRLGREVERAPWNQGD